MTAKSINNPWKKFAHLVTAPLDTLAELLATSDIIGCPPTSPESTFPKPTAERSLLKSDFLLYGSTRSIALAVKRDSIEPISKNKITYCTKTPV